MPRLPKGITRKKNRPGYYVRDQRGGKDRIYFAGLTVELAKKKRAAVCATTLPVERATVEKAARRWLDRAVKLSRNERGHKLAERRVERNLIPALGMRPLALVTADDLRGYRLALESTEKKHGGRLAPQTVAHVLSDARCFFLWCVDEGYMDRSPVPRRLLPRIQERAPDRLTEEEVEKLIALPEPWGFYLRLLLGTGIRWGEARRAEAKDVERGQLVLSQTKTGRIRRVPLAPGLAAELRGRVGRLLHVVLAQSLAKQGRKVVPRFHVHMTRHTFACRWLEHGGSITALQEILGHSSVTTTQRYGRPNEDSIRREAERSWGA